MIKAVYPSFHPIYTLIRQRSLDIVLCNVLFYIIFFTYHSDKYFFNVGKQNIFKKCTEWQPLKIHDALLTVLEYYPNTTNRLYISI